ncbi:MAG: PGF-pre-PGF domain-containing protein, partial [Nanoarchaeota archaeon]|nr:PGF-pre-PGF domain-containing protein [Nanoarchaeota archaeon]
MNSSYQYVNITKKNFNNSQIDNATIDFKVNKSWILSNNFTRIWLAHYDNGWNKLRTNLLNSTATVNYYRAYTNAFSYFAIIGEKAQTAQAAPPAVEQPKEPVKEETNAEQPKEPDAPAVEEHKAAPPYYAYFLAAVVLILAAAYVIKKYLNDDDEAPQNEQVPEP